ncbi:MAG: serine hydroxymethyltransferase [Candidatus Doudnabacteria bacterium]|nr:serine hydroxymethyltransferase [Candidatus Doudnabacteria bacterium]
MNLSHIQSEDLDLYALIKKEAERQKEGLELIPSENYTSPAVMESMGSILTNKYSEGYAKKRYYGGNEFIDNIELLAIERAKNLFGVPHANVQPYSGSPANLAIYMATCQPGDVVLGLNLTDGGHLTHGWKVSATGIFYKTYGYHSKPDGRVDFDEVRKLAKEHKPKLIWCGATAYMYEIEYEQFAEIADSVGAFLAADIAHVAGLIAAGAHKSPANFAHIITTTTHKTLRGPRGGMIMATHKGLEKDPELGDKMDKAVFPGLQGGPHDHQTGAIAIALKEAATEEFKKYGHQIVKNAKALAESLKNNGIKLVGNGTENHLLLLDLVPVYGPGGGAFGSEVLELAGMTANKNTIPGEPGSPFYPSGVRMGTPALTTRGMKEKEMEKVGKWIASAIMEAKDYQLPGVKEDRSPYLSKFKKEIKGNETLKKIREEIKQFTKDFPVPGIE